MKRYKIKLVNDSKQLRSEFENALKRLEIEYKITRYAETLHIFGATLTDAQKDYLTFSDKFKGIIKSIEEMPKVTLY